MKYANAVLLLLSLSLGAFAQEQLKIEEEWRGFSDPEIMSSGFTHAVSQLPMEGMIEIGPKAWSGHYWPSQKGGINSRWNAPDQPGFSYKSPNKEVVMSMSVEQLKELAPSEKFDLWMGNYDYPMRQEAEGTASARAKDWAGICHGWAPATLHHNEPTSKMMKNPDGLIIPFGSADIKALLSYYYAFYFEAETTQQIGLRCFFGGWLGGARACTNDLNAGAFHIIIANKLGLQKEGFLADVDRYKEVWNQPIVGFKSKILADNLRPSSDAAKRTVREMRIATELYYVDESDPKWEAVHGTIDQVISKKELQYRVEISVDGKIVGGDWESDERPDFLWSKPKAPGFTGALSRLNELLND